MLNKIKSNWKSGLTVALVSVPLSISLAVASGVSPEQGIITAIWSGLIASLFGSSNYNIVGPTGALSGLIAGFVLTHGPAYVSMLAITSGCMILIAYAMHLDRYLIFIPSSVMHGFTLGIACIIALNQLNFIFGLRNLQVHAEFIDNVQESLRHLHEISWPTVIVFVSFFIALQLLRRYFRAIPGAVLLSPIGILLGYFGTSLHLETLASRYGTVSNELIKIPSLLLSLDVIKPAFVIALIAALETMLSAKIADSLTKTKHADGKELLGLGLANIASGFAGGMPATAALARTALNIRSGATHRTSATVCSIMIGVISFACLSYFKYMPMAVIAAILVHVAWGMIERERFIRLYKHDKLNFLVALVVAFITIYKDPIIGILGGALISLLFFVEKLSHGYYETDVKSLEVPNAAELHQAEKAGILIYTFRGKLTYINSRAHMVRFESGIAQHYPDIILHLQGVNFMDIDGIDALDEIIEMLQKQEKLVFITGAQAHIKKLLVSLSPHAAKLERDGLFLDTPIFKASI